MKTIDYVLANNPLTKNENERLARVVNQRTHTDSDLANALASRNIGVSKPEALALIEAITEILLEWIANGDAATLTLGHYHATIPGTFKDGEYPKEADCKITPSKEIIEAVKKVSLRHVEARLQIHIDYIHDVQTNTSNEKVTQGGTVKITGHNIKIAGDNKEIGIEFISLETGSTYKVPAGYIITNHPSELLIIAPKMPAGEQVILKITTQYANTAKFLKDPRSITFHKELTVV
ncbi:MAG: DUF4469 domain-containing protein [Dysgonamonadaceae bacterium]|jgi:nucleoid DNA-binding protein|nr:DUF4469 domain-containing protein [Dysgonamonadaceae bacterium]